MENINKETRKHLEQEDWGQVTQTEIEFHCLIARQTNNPILILILDFVENLLDDFKKILKPDSEFMNRVLSYHDIIYEAILNKDGEKASQEMLNHVLDVEKYLARLKKEKQGGKLWQNCLQSS